MRKISGLNVKTSKHKRGQSTVEMALVLPLIVVLLSIVIEAGLALNTWIRVNTAARDATRFALDAGRPGDIASLVLNKMEGFNTSSNVLDVYIITGTTSGGGSVNSWSVDHRYGSRTGGPNVTQNSIQSKLTYPPDPSANQNLEFTVVEVDYKYTPLLATLIARNSWLPMTSYAIVQQ